MAEVFVMSWDLECDLRAPRAARQLLRQELGNAIHQDVLDALLLLASEVVTNAVVHARSRALLSVALRPHSVLVSVSDVSAGPPAPSVGALDWEHGRGLAMVQEVAAAWGVHAHGSGGKTVWFQLDLVARSSSAGEVVRAGTVHI